LVPKPINVNKHMTRKVFIKQLVPTIKSLDIFHVQLNTIQQDNARPHLSLVDPEFVEESREGSLDIKLVNQPPNSLDLNLLDLGFSTVIQALQQQRMCTSVDDLVCAVQMSFGEYPPEKINKDLSLQSCMLEIIHAKGANGYKVLHLGKDALSQKEKCQFI
jgi:hypothetical protein